MKKNKLAMGAFGTLIAITATGAVTVSCGQEADKTNPSRDKIEFNGISKTLDDYIKLLNKTSTADASQVRDVINKANRFLYEKEQKASVNYKKIKEQSIKDHAKRNNKSETDAIKKANIKALESISKITDRVKSEFEDQKDAYKNVHGHGWEQTWPAELAKNAKYGGAKSDKEAISHMVDAELGSQAFSRYLIKKDNFWYKADLDKAIKGDKSLAWLKKQNDDGFVFSPFKDIDVKKLNADDKITVVATASFDVNQKGIGNVVKEYLKKFDPIYVNHLLLKAAPDAKDPYKPWKIDSMDTLKSWLMTDGVSAPIIDGLATFKGLDFDAKDKKFKIDSKDKNILESGIAGNSTGTQKIGGSLGLKDQLEYISQMDPGFALPILTYKDLGNENMQTLFPKAKVFEESVTNPLTGIGEKILNALQKELDGTQFTASYTKEEDYIKAVTDLISSINDDTKILTIAGTVFRDSFGIKRNLSYKVGNNKLVLSTFGVHVINGHSIQSIAAQMFPAQAANLTNVEYEKTLLEMIKWDSQREILGEPVYFNAIKEISNDSSNQMNIIKNLLNETSNPEFVKFLKTQDNYGAKSDQISINTYPKYTDEDIKKINDVFVKGFEKTEKQSRANASVSKINPWLNEAHKNSTLVSNKSTPWNYDDWTASVQDIYNTAILMAKKGVTK